MTGVQTCALPISRKLAQSTWGSKTSGSAPSLRISVTMSLFTPSRNVRQQHSQFVSMSTERAFPRKRPCTKGVAIASSPQAPKSRSPVLKISRCGVSATVTGKAHSTSPLSFRTR